MTKKSLGQEILILKEQVKEIEPLKQRVFELLEIVNNLKIKENNMSERFQAKEILQEAINCNICGKKFATKKKLKIHMQEMHPQKIECKNCDKVFMKKCDLEVHIKSQHQKLNDYTCDMCDKKFVLKWRFLKHQDNHNNQNRRKCHYFNNGKNCPFEEIGCMFAHEASKMCMFDEICCKTLCSYKHTSSQNQNQKSRMMCRSSGMNSRIFKTSTPKKLEYECEGCADKSECVECIVKRVREEHGWDGGVTTAQCTPTPGCSDLEASSSSASGCGGASSSFS